MKFLGLVFVLFLGTVKAQAIDIYAGGNIFGADTGKINTNLTNSTNQLKTGFTSMGWQNITVKQTSPNGTQFSYGLGARLPIGNGIKLGIGYDYVDFGYSYYEVNGTFSTNQWIKASEKDSATANLPYISGQYEFYENAYFEVNAGWGFSQMTSYATVSNYNGTAHNADLNGTANSNTFWGSAGIGYLVHFTNNIGLNLTAGYQRLDFSKYTISSIQDNGIGTKTSVGDTMTDGANQNLDVDLSSVYGRASLVFTFDLPGQK